jgi:hypothetical protein
LSMYQVSCLVIWKKKQDKFSNYHFKMLTKTDTNFEFPAKYIRATACSGMSL